MCFISFHLDFSYKNSKQVGNYDSRNVISSLDDNFGAVPRLGGETAGQGGLSVSYIEIVFGRRCGTKKHNKLNLFNNWNISHLRDLLPKILWQRRSVNQ